MPYFEFVDGTSSKFWNIHDYWNSDKPYVEVRFGKIGTTGRTTQGPDGQGWQTPVDPA